MPRERGLARSPGKRFRLYERPGVCPPVKVNVPDPTGAENL